MPVLNSARSDSYSTSPPPFSFSFSPVSTVELKMYQSFMFSVPIFFAFVLLFLFYLFYLRRRRVDWDALRMRTSLDDSNDSLRAELGLEKELREMLPIIVYKESFCVRDARCAVCLADYQADDKLQQIPTCGHTYHMDCIDNWLANHTTCPLCRISLLPSAKGCSRSHNGSVASVTESGGETSAQPEPQDCEESQSTQISEQRNEYCGAIQNNVGEEQRRSENTDDVSRNGRNENEPQENDGGSSA
uniref:RING-type E3 ubiquitin transferase n=1 Tax=Rhizophora mucronata TaxID=61149 RepID=A0A2P2J774_RHIMU